MCTLTLGLAAAAAGATMYGNQQAADAKAAQARAQAHTYEQNAKIEGRYQEQLADKYAQQSRAIRDKERLTSANARANAGAAGIGVNGSTSIMDILGGSLENEQQDQMINLGNQRWDNYSSRVNQANYINNANALNAQADNIENAAQWQNIATLVGFAGQAAGALSGAPKTASDTASSGLSVSSGSSNNYFNLANGGKIDGNFAYGKLPSKNIFTWK